MPVFVYTRAMKIPMPVPVLGLSLVLLLLAAGCGGDDAPPPAETAAPAATMTAETVDAMSREHAGDEAVPSGATEGAAGVDVVSEELAYAEVGDSLVQGYFAAPTTMVEPLPAVIMIHEWWGLNDNIRAMADKLAGEGYMVLAVDLYGGRVADNVAGARSLMTELVENQALAEENLRQAHAFLKEVGAPRVASLGWCLGGHWSLRTALLLSADLDAAVMYYGQVILDETALSALDAPLLGLFAAEDTGIRLGSVESFDETLDALGKEAAIEVYPGVGHAFANPTGNNYDAAAAGDAWARTLDFLSAHLAPAAGGAD